MIVGNGSSSSFPVPQGIPLQSIADRRSVRRMSFLVVDVTSTTEPNDTDQEDVVLDGESIVAYPDMERWPASEGSAPGTIPVRPTGDRAESHVRRHRDVAGQEQPWLTDRDC